jgi:hypothetical protein
VDDETDDETESPELPIVAPARTPAPPGLTVVVPPLAAPSPPEPEPEPSAKVDEALVMLCIICADPLDGATAQLTCEAGHGCCYSCAEKLAAQRMPCPLCCAPLKTVRAPVWSDTLDKLNAAGKRVASAECELGEARGKIAKLEEKLAAAEAARAAAEAEAKEAHRAVVRVILEGVGRAGAA